MVIFIPILALAPTLSKYALFAPSSIHLNTLLLPISRSLCHVGLFALTETWITFLSTGAERSNATPPGFTLISCPRPAPATKSHIVGGAQHFSLVNLVVFFLHLLKPSSHVKCQLSLSNSASASISSLGIFSALSSSLILLLIYLILLTLTIQRFLHFLTNMLHSRAKVFELNKPLNPRFTPALSKLKSARHLERIWFTTRSSHDLNLFLHCHQLESLCH